MIKTMYLRFLIGAAFLIGCNSNNLFVKHRPESPVPESFPLSTEAPKLTAQKSWWTSFNDQELNNYMDELFNDNLDLAQAWARLRQAEARLGVSRSDGKLQLDAEASARGTKRKDEIGDKTQTYGTENYSVGLVARYELDLWDRIQDQELAAELELRASKAQIQSTAMLLSAEAVQSWISLKAVTEQLKLLNEQMKTNQQTLELISHRQRRGLANIVDLYQQRQQLARIKSLTPGLEEQRKNLELKLLLLSGKNLDQKIEISSSELPVLQEIPSRGIPAEVLNQRPDIQQAWLQLQAGEYRLNASKKARLPRLTLTAEANFNNEKFSEIFDNWFSSLAAGLTAPLLDGGRLESQELLAQAQSDEDYLNYRQTTLEALNEVESAYTSEKWKLQEVVSVANEVSFADSTLKETMRRYRRGLSDYLPVLTAIATHQQAERNLTVARAELILNRINIHRSLGGNWDLKENNALLPEAEIKEN